MNLHERRSRRGVLRAGALAAASAIAGCTGFTDEPSDSTPGSDDEPAVPDLPQVDDPPDAVYVPTHREAMVHLPTVEIGEYALSPMLTYPHPFWLVTGTTVEEVVPEDGRGIHLMVTVWDRKTEQVLPVDAGAEMRVRKDGDVVDQRAPWPMISQTMGFHFGDNVVLPEDGTYTVEFDLNPITTKKTGAFADRFDRAETATFEFEYDDEFRRAVVDGIEYLDEELWGRRGALEPMEHAHVDHGHDDGHHDDHHDDGHHEDGHHDDHHTDGHHEDGHHDDHHTDSHHDDHHDDHHTDSHHDDHHDDHHHDGRHRMPFSSLPPAEEYPGLAVGEPQSGDATFVVRYLESSRFADDGYLFVSPRTPYNRVPLADMALSVTGAVDSQLEQTLDDELGLHYGVAADLEPGDEFELVVESPPQVARHAGYETAFVEMPAMELEVTE